MKTVSLMIVVVALAVAPLAGCVTVEDYAEQDRTRCLSYGFGEGTDAYALCRMQLDQARLQRQAAANANLMATGLALMNGS